MSETDSESRKTLVIQNALGLHARAAARLVQVANRYPCDFFIRRDELEVNGKSIMGVLMLAASPGSEIEVRAVGLDAETRRALLDEIEQLIKQRFGETS